MLFHKVCNLYIFLFMSSRFKLTAKVSALCNGGAIEAKISNFAQSLTEELPLNFVVYSFSFLFFEVFVRKL